MLSLRAFSRSIPRVSRSIARTSLRPAVLPKPTPQPWKLASKPIYAAFSTSSVFREPAAEGKSIPSPSSSLPKSSEYLSHALCPENEL